MMLDRFHVFTITTLAAVNAALAQATPPATSGSPAATTDGGASWLWIIIGLAIIAGLVWYFMRGRSRATTAAGGAKVYDSDKRK